jgi:hypothetical protein
LMPLGGFLPAWIPQKSLESPVVELDETSRNSPFQRPGDGHVEPSIQQSLRALLPIRDLVQHRNRKEMSDVNQSAITKLWVRATHNTNSPYGRKCR